MTVFEKKKKNVPSLNTKHLCEGCVFAYWVWISNKAAQYSICNYMQWYRPVWLRFVGNSVFPGEPKFEFCLSWHTLQSYTTCRISAMSCELSQILISKTYGVSHRLMRNVSNTQNLNLHSYFHPKKKKKNAVTNVY